MLRFSLAESPAPPGVGEACSRRRFRRSSCRACVDVCPVQALSFTGSGPILNNDHCIRCGNCLFACPVGAGALTNLSPVARYYRRDRLVSPFSSCPASANELLIWHTDYAIRGVEMELDAHPAWGREIAILNLRLQALGEPAWCVYPPQESTVDIVRRKMLHTKGGEVRCHAATPDANRSRQAFPQQSEFALAIDRQACLLCGACFRACPTAVFTVGEETLSIREQSCSGCEICVAVCPTKAISITPYIHKTSYKDIPLCHLTCKSCGRLFISWEGNIDECAICRQHNHGMR
ncbi:4Fe-4S binding protein [Yokenella regensburgei]|uniref:4Fe-4S binding protein n=1 Tax=Yokenella regensburgei TaxID=158877 RepID=UPI003F145E6F